MRPDRTASRSARSAASDAAGCPQEVLVVFAREVRAGRVKSRLAAVLGEARTLAVYRRLALRTIAVAARVAASRPGCRLTVALDDPDGGGGPLANRCAARGIAVQTQRGSDLGERMWLAIKDSVRGAQRVVLVGCDAPTLDPSYVGAAFERLAGAPVVLGPTEDGGYVLIGVRAQCLDSARTLFAGISWGGPDVAHQTREAAARAALGVAELELRWDVDRAADVARWAEDRRMQRLLRRRLLVAALGVNWLRVRPVSAAAMRDEGPAPGGALVRFSALPISRIVASPEPADAISGQPGEQAGAVSSAAHRASRALGWRVARLAGVAPNRQAIVLDGAVHVLRIDSDHSASVLVHRVPDVLRAARALRWRWKVSGFPPRSDFGRKDADDFAARVYVAFDYPLDRLAFGDRVALRLARALRGDVPAAALVYVWHPSLPVGTLAPSPYTDRARMIVARGSPRSGQWFEESRDIVADFRRAFGDEYGPGVAPIESIAVGADTDQTGGVLTAWFGDVTLVA